jgi:flagellar hook-associated protein 2
MSGPISFGGLSSGLDTNAIISALVQAESVPINQLNAQKGSEQQKINLLGTFEGYINSLKDKVAELSKDQSFLANSVNVSQDGYFSVTSTGSAATGGYTLEVNSVAASDRIALSGSGGITDPDADFGDADISFDYGGETFEVILGSGASSLNDIAAAINAETGGEVNAQVVNTGTASTPNYQLVLSGKETGAEFAISNLSFDVGTGDLDTQTQLTTASNAEIVLNGLTIQRSSNDFADVVDGLSIQVESVTTEQVGFTVALDEDGVTDKLQEFVDAYNKVVNFVNAQNAYSEEGGTGGALFGDSSLRTVSNALNRSLFSNSLIDSTSSFGSLGLVGVKLGTDGTLSLDAAKVKEKLAEDPDAFADFFLDTDGFDNGGALEGTPNFYVDTSADSGLFALLEKSLAALMDSQPLSSGGTAKGLIAQRKETLQENITQIDKQVERLQFRIAGFEQALVAQFSALEQTMNRLNSQSSALNQLQSLNLYNNNN